MKKFKKWFNFFCIQMKSKGLRNVGLIWNQMRQQRESGEMQAAAHFQSSSNSWLVKDLSASWGACSWHTRRRISTTSQHILHLLDQFYYHHCSTGLQKITWCNSDHTFPPPFWWQVGLPPKNISRVQNCSDITISTFILTIVMALVNWSLSLSSSVVSHGLS